MKKIIRKYWDVYWFYALFSISMSILSGMTSNATGETHSFWGAFEWGVYTFIILYPIVHCLYNLSYKTPIHKLVKKYNYYD